MTDEQDKKPRVRSATAQPVDLPTMGPALRSVYQQTIEEAIPAEMLDLLSKLD